MTRIRMGMSYNDAKRYVRSLAETHYVEECPFTIAVVVLRNDSLKRPLIAKGLSTCSPTDKWDVNRGKNIARGRAEAKLARRLVKMTKSNPLIITAECTCDAAAMPRVSAGASEWKCCHSAA